MNKLIFGAIALSLALTASAGLSTPKRELRSTWFTTHVNIDWPHVKGSDANTIATQKAALLNYLDGFEKMKLNGICFHVRAQCDACYRSSYEPWSAVITGTRGKDPGWDPLAYAIDECHKRGLECYAWINPYRWSNGPDYKTPQDLEFKAKGWILSYGNYYVINPAIPEVREHILKVCKEIVDNYALDGVLFDDYFYPNNIPENESAGDWALYKASGANMSIGDWRRENVNIFVREFRDMIEAAHPDMRFGISPAGVAGDANTSAPKFGVEPNPVAATDWQYGTIYSDPLAWLSDGSIDFISPQIYWTTKHSTAPFEPLCKWWNYIADHFGRHFYTSHSVSFLADANTQANWAEVARQVELNRAYATTTRYNAPGEIFFSSKYFFGPTVSGLDEYLIEHSYPTHALAPVVPWKKIVTFGAPADLRFDGTKLTWTPIAAPRSILRYTVYAVPQNLSIDKASEADGDGISNDYLLKTCYGSEFTLPADKRSGYWYAVCAYDGASNEFEPATYNYPYGTSRKVTLTAPAEGEKVDWSANFSWTPVQGASYVVRIARDAAISDVVFTSGLISENTLLVNFDDMDQSTRYYWDVQCFEPDKLRSTSDSRSFVTPANVDAPKVTLVSPADGTVLEGTGTFSWTAVQGVDGYKLEVARDKDFTDIVYTGTYAPDVTSTDINVSYVGKGHFYWHVITSGRHLNPVASDSRTFSVEKITIGAFEPGYEIKKDPATYAAVNNIRVENLWMRSNKDGFGNISFAGNGMQDRSMVAVGEYVYLTHRSENSEGAVLSLEKYDGLTGEHIGSILIGGAANIAYFPLNTVTKDDNDNVVIANLVLNAMTTPVVLHQVDLKDGSLTEVARITLPDNLERARVDHVAVSGNVASGNFNVYMALSSTGNLARVTYADGKQTELKISSHSTFSPSSSSSFGIAAAITPVTRDEVLVNGGGTTMARYNIATGRMVDSFASNKDISDSQTTANGSGRFALGTSLYTVFPSNDHRGNGYRFDILRSDDDTFAGMKRIASVPAEGLGYIDSSTSSTPISAVCDPDGTARVYVYAVGNGIAAYRINDPSSGVSTVKAADDLKIGIEGSDIVLNRRAVQLDVYTVTGALVATVRGVDRLTVPGAGVYIVIAEGVTARVAVR